MWRWGLCLSLTVSLGGCFLSSGRGDGPPSEGCSDALVLGPGGDLRFAPEIAFTGNDFVVAWFDYQGDGQRVWLRRVAADGSAITARAMRTDDRWAFPRVAGRDGEAWYFAVRDQAVWRERLGSDLAAEPADRLTNGTLFTLAPLDDDRVAVAASRQLWIEGGATYATSIASRSRMGWNGRDFLIGDVLGHGSHWLRAMGREGERIDPPLELQYTDDLRLASSPETGRHALALGGPGELRTWVQGWDDGLVSWPLASAQVEADMVWDGDAYRVLVADGSGTEPRDLWMLDLQRESWTRLLTTPEDDRAPALAASGPGEVGIAWRSEDEILFMRCSL